MWYLVVRSEKHHGKKIRLVAGPFIIGRGDEAQVRIGSEEVSRSHCVLEPGEDRVTLRDLESRNGTLVNGVRISGETQLDSGAMIEVGPMKFELIRQEAAPAPASAPRIRVPRKADSQKLSDEDEIASWLSDSEIMAGADTTISGAPEQPTATEQPVEAAPPGLRPPPPSKQRFDSIAEEAADIIRRHREYLKLLEEAESDPEG